MKAAPLSKKKEKSLCLLIVRSMDVADLLTYQVICSLIHETLNHSESVSLDVTTLLVMQMMYGLLIVVQTFIDVTTTVRSYLTMTKSQTTVKFN